MIYGYLPLFDVLLGDTWYGLALLLSHQNVPCFHAVLKNELLPSFSKCDLVPNS